MCWHKGMLLDAYPVINGQSLLFQRLDFCSNFWKARKIKGLRVVQELNWCEIEGLFYNPDFV